MTMTEYELLLEPKAPEQLRRNSFFSFPFQKVTSSDKHKMLETPIVRPQAGDVSIGVATTIPLEPLLFSSIK